MYKVQMEIEELYNNEDDEYEYIDTDLMNISNDMDKHYRRQMKLLTLLLLY